MSVQAKKKQAGGGVGGGKKRAEGKEQVRA